MNSCNLECRYCYYFHFIDEVTEVQRGEVNLLKVTQLVNGRAKFQIQADCLYSSWIQGLCLISSLIENHQNQNVCSGMEFGPSVLISILSLDLMDLCIILGSSQSFAANIILIDKKTNKQTDSICILYCVGTFVFPSQASAIREPWTSWCSSWF